MEGRKIMTKYERKFYQHGTLGMLVPGLFEGTMTVADLLKHGDWGIGTASGLDGEMILLDHVPYLAQSNGEIRILKPEEKVPFATVHFEEIKDSFKVENLTQKELEDKILADYPYKNVFFAVKIVGNFSTVKTRVVEKQTRPYKTLLQVANEQAVFESTDVSGTVIGYFAPKMFQGMAAAGYHLHFLADNKSIGGHLLDFNIKEATVYLQPFTTIEQHLPMDNQEFLNKDLDIADMHDQIQKAEG